MTCQLYQQEELSQYLDGELPATRAARLEAHLRVCPHCQGEMNELRGIAGYIRSASRELQVSRDFDRRVLRAVGYYQIAARQTRTRSYLRPLLLAAVSLLALLGLVQHFLTDQPPTSPQLQPARASVAPALPSAPIPARDRR